MLKPLLGLIAILFLDGSSDQERIRTVQGKALDEEGKPIPRATISLTVRDGGKSAYYKNQLSGPDGSYTFTEVPTQGEGILYLSNRPRDGAVEGQAVEPSMPVDTEKHACIGARRDFAQIAVLVPASVKEANLTLRKGARLEIAVANPPKEFLGAGLSPKVLPGTGLAYGTLTKSPDPQHFVFSGLLTTEGAVAFNAHAVFKGPGASALTSIAWSQSFKALAGELAKAELEIPKFDLTRTAIEGTVMVGEVVYSDKNKEAMTTAGYYIGEPLPLAQPFQRAVVVRAWKKDGSLTVESHPTEDGRFVLAGLEPGEYLASASYLFSPHLLKFMAMDDSDPRTGEIRGQPYAVTVGAKPGQMIVTFPSPLPPDAKRLSERKFSTDVRYRSP
ncbi:MAG TPA: carboxypeptidase-like regulatory domain-containing protein [Planctomycetota bacterium]